MYGVERYIEKCLMSCILQDAVLGVEYEIICINDGTKDKSAEIAKRIAAKYNGVIVFDQENGGLSAARNAGLKKTKGEYVWFVDSDDWISECSLARILSKLVDGVDILQLQYRWAFDAESKSYDEPFTILEGVQSGRVVTMKGGLPSPAQFSIFRRDFLLKNKLEFVEGIYHEDSEFKPRAVYLAQKITSDDKVSYNYYQRIVGSIMSSFSVKRAKDIIFVNNSLSEFVNKLDAEVQSAINLKIGLNMNSLFYGYWELSREDRKLVRELLSHNKHLFERMINCPSKKYRIEGHLFTCNVRVGLLLYKLFKI